MNMWGVGYFLLLGVITANLFSGPAVAADFRDLEASQKRWVMETPVDPSEAWLIAFGGRLYDNFAEAQGKTLPPFTHSAYPKAGKKKGPATWRCKECHGWDYNGVDGAYKKGSHFTGIKGIRAYDGGDPAKVAEILRDKTHRYSESFLSDEMVKRLALFVTKGQMKVEDFLVKGTNTVRGDLERGKAAYQNLCAVCHDYDGRGMNFGGADNPTYVGTEAVSNPAEVFHKVRNGNAGDAMTAQMWLDAKTQADIVAYTQTLPTK